MTYFVQKTQAISSAMATKIWSPGLVFKIDAINGKKWVNFVAMQQNSATLIYDLNTMKGTVESYLEKICQTIQNSFLHIHMYLHVNSPQCHKHLLEQLLVIS